MLFKRVVFIGTPPGTLLVTLVQRFHPARGRFGPLAQCSISIFSATSGSNTCGKVCLRERNKANGITLIKAMPAKLKCLPFLIQGCW